MAARRRRRKGAATAQAWIELKADDPEALSALEVARSQLAAGRDLTALRRLRLFELMGALPAGDELAERLHRSTQFYNPHKERCLVRHDPTGEVPAAADAWLALVVERGGDRRPAAERWWHHESGERIEVREGVAWVLGFRRAAGAEAAARELAELADRAHGLFANPHAQDVTLARGATVPLPWWAALTRGPARDGGAT